MQVLNVHTEDIAITTSILLIRPKTYHKSVTKKLTDYLSSNGQKKSDAIFCFDYREIG